MYCFKIEYWTAPGGNGTTFALCVTKDSESIHVPFGPQRHVFLNRLFDIGIGHKRAAALQFCRREH